MKFCLEWKLYSQLTFMWAIPCRLVNCEVRRTLNNNESPFINERLIMNFDSINLLLLIFRWLYALICWNSQNGLTLGREEVEVRPTRTLTVLNGRKIEPGATVNLHIYRKGHLGRHNTITPMHGSHVYVWFLVNSNGRKYDQISRTVKFTPQRLPF